MNYDPSYATPRVKLSLQSGSLICMVRREIHVKSKHLMTLTPLDVLHLDLVGHRFSHEVLINYQINT